MCSCGAPGIGWTAPSNGNWRDRRDDTDRRVVARPKREGTLVRRLAEGVVCVRHRRLVVPGGRLGAGAGGPPGPLSPLRGTDRRESVGANMTEGTYLMTNQSRNNGR